MLSPIIEEALNNQIKVEAESSQVYLAMASWAEVLGFEGVAQFMYAHSDEERMHMLKLVQYVNERGGQALIPQLNQPEQSYPSITNLFQTLLDHEVMVSNEINNLVDISSAEILRGPQGTLFGRNTPAGAIQINTVKPSHEADGFIDATAGNFGLVNLNAAGGFSVIDDVLAVRATGFSSQRDGWVDQISIGNEQKNAINDRNRYGVRLQALYTPTDNVEVRVIADYAEIDESCCGTSVVQDNNEPDQRRPGTPLGSDSVLAQRGTFISGDRVFDQVAAYNYIPVSQNDDSGVSVQVDWDLEAFTLTSITAWRDFSSFDDIDSDFTDLDALSITNDASQSSVSQELRISGSTDTLNYVAGAFYFTQDLDSTQILSVGEDTGALASVFAGFPLPASFFPVDGFSTTTNQQQHDSWALFGQFDYQLTDDLVLTTGLRYTEENKDLVANYTETNAGPGFALFPPLAPRSDVATSISDEKVTGTFKLSWNFTDTALAYVSYGTGYKSGGTNSDRIPEDFTIEFDAETSESYEVGMKAEFPDQALRLNVALHMTDYSDLQVNTFNGTGFNLRNAGTAETYGGEVELTWQATETLQITSSYARTISDYGSFDQGNCWLASPFRGVVDPGGDGTLTPAFCDRAGAKISPNPEDFFIITARQEFTISDGITGFVLGEYNFVGEQFMESSNDPYEFQDSYNLINLRAGLILEEYGVEVTAWGRNVTNTEYYGTNFDPPIQEGKLNAYQRDPATYGVTARKFF